MAGLRLFTSNRLELLAENLAAVLREPPADPLRPEMIVVQSQGMARWIAMQLADRAGVCMNCEFPFPRDVVLRAFRAWLPETEATADLTPERMTWQLMELLATARRGNTFAQVSRYLGDSDPLKRFQLAEKVANLFDQYLVYRPEMLLGWKKKSAREDWQAALWRELIPPDSTHLAALQTKLRERIAAGAAPDDTLPARLSIFGISSMPPMFLEAFFHLAKHREVNLFILDPTQEYAGDLKTPKQRAHLLKRLGNTRVSPGELHLHIGNPLLASLGKQSRELMELILEFDERTSAVSDSREQFSEPGADTLLHAIQSDVLHIVARGAGEHPRTPIADRSIQVHSCHSPMREMEVLYDHLLDLFNCDSTLRPRDVLVMTPDIDTYAPFIHAVFGAPENPARRIAFSVADRRPRSESAIIDTFLALLELPGARCTSREILSLLESPPLRRRFGLSDPDLASIRRWIAESGIRWGIDAAHRESLGLPAVEGNTWQSGLDRLLLGYAMAGRDVEMFADILPYDDVEGSAAEVLGRFASAARALFETARAFAGARQPGAWADAMDSLLGRVFDATDADEIADLKTIRAALGRLAEMAGGQELDFRVVRYHLGTALDADAPRGNFLQGGVTFCALKPMRSIPARVVCLVGMGDQAFPRRSTAPAFDLMQSEPRLGDRSTRDDDRHVFLEAILSARDQLFMSFVGRSIRDNEGIPPSVLVSELLDYCEQAFEFPDGKRAAEFLVTTHRLHAFSPDYFGRNAALFSYSESNAAASRLLGTQPAPAPSFAEVVLPEPAAELRNVELSHLLDFFSNPAAHFLERRLGLRLREKEDTLEETEPFAVERLAAYHLKQELAESDLANARRAGWREFAARGVLPLGEAGRFCFEGMRRETAAFVERVRAELKGQPLAEPVLEIFEIAPFTLSGRIEPLYGEQLVLFRCADIKPKDVVRAWIVHLANCLHGSAERTTVIGADQTFRFRPAQSPANLLRALLDIYWAGQSHPQPFFPGTALAYCEHKRKPKAQKDPLVVAREKWAGTDRVRGECNDPNYQYIFGSENPIGDWFVELAGAVIEPLLDHKEKA